MRSVSIVLLCVAGLWSSIARADIDVKPQYDPNEPIVATVTITDVPAGAKLRGSFAIDGGSYLPAGENVYHCWAGPGVHKITSQGVWVLTQDIKVGDQTVPALIDFGQFSYTKTITVGPEVPVPDPFPPKPDPQPKPGGPYQILLLYDQDQLDNLPASQRALLTSLEYRQKLQSLGHRVLGVFAAQSLSPSTIKYKAYLDAAKNVPLPAIAYADLAGGKVTCVSLPADYETLAKLLDKGVPK